MRGREHSQSGESPSSDEPAPREIADLLRSGEPHQQQRAYAALKRQIGLLAHHRYFANHREATIDDVVQELCVRLLRSPAKLAAISISSAGWGAINTEIKRLLTELAGGNAASESFALRRHLYRKTRAALREGPPPVEQMPGYWAVPATSAPVLDPRELLERMPPLPSVLKSQRAGQLPPLAKPRPLRAHVVLALKKANRTCSLDEVFRLMWDLLAPPAPVFTQVPETYLEGLLHANVDLHASEMWEARFDIEKDRWLAALDRRTKRIVLGYFRRSESLEQIAAELGIGKTRAHQLKGDFEKRLREIVAKYSLSKEQRGLFFDATLNGIEVELFDSDGAST